MNEVKSERINRCDSAAHVSSLASPSRYTPDDVVSDLIRATNGLPRAGIHRAPPRSSVVPRTTWVDAGAVALEQRLRGYHNGLRDANRHFELGASLVGSGTTRQSRACLVPSIGVALSGATAATFRNRAPGRGSDFIMYHYTGPRRAVCTAVTGTRRACVLFSPLLRPGRRRLLLLPFFARSVRVRIRVERCARYAHHRVAR